MQKKKILLPPSSSSSQKKKHAKSQYARKYKPREDVRAKHTFFFFFCARASLCKYNKVGTDETRRCSGVPHGTKCSLLAHFVWRLRKERCQCPRRRTVCVCVFSDESQKNATASLASGNVREHAGARAGGSRQRENAVPRPLVCHVLNVDHRAFAKTRADLFRSLLCFFLNESICPHIVGSKKKKLTTRTQLNFAKLFIRRLWPKRVMPDRKLQPLNNNTVFFAHVFSV